jgi:hypothetical protein
MGRGGKGKRSKLEKDTSTLESVGNMAAFFLWGIFNCRGIGIGITLLVENIRCIICKEGEKIG